MGARCTGRCCEAFFIASSVEELLALAERAETVQERTEIATIAGMIVTVREVFPGDPHPGSDDTEHTARMAGFVYTCRHYDDRTGNCEIYESRPSMCSSYPYERGRCGFAACTWSEAKAPCERRGPKLHLVVLASEETARRRAVEEALLLAEARAARADARWDRRVG